MRDDIPEVFGKPKKQNHEKKPDKKSDEDDDEHEEEKKDDKSNDDSDEPKKPPFYKRPIPMLIIAGILLITIIVALLWWLRARQFQSTDDAFIDGHIIAISPNVAATVASVHIDDNWHVKKGDLLVELDPKDFQVIVNQMTANFAGTRPHRASAGAAECFAGKYRRSESAAVERGGEF